MIFLSRLLTVIGRIDIFGKYWEILFCLRLCNRYNSISKYPKLEWCKTYNRKSTVNISNTVNRGSSCNTVNNITYQPISQYSNTFLCFNINILQQMFNINILPYLNILHKFSIKLIGFISPSFRLRCYHIFMKINFTRKQSF